MATQPPEPPESDEREDKRGAPAGQFGNVPFQPTDKQRQDVITYAKTFPEHKNGYIAKLIGVSVRTLTKYFRHELDLGRAQMLASVGAQVISAALNGDAETAKGDRDLQKFVLARLGGWSTKVEMTGKDGGPVESFDVASMDAVAFREMGRAAAIERGLDPDEAVGPSLLK